jgi:hypothetical protein
MEGKCNRIEWNRIFEHPQDNDRSKGPNAQELSPWRHTRSLRISCASN